MEEPLFFEKFEIFMKFRRTMDPHKISRKKRVTFGPQIGTNVHFSGQTVSILLNKTSCNLKAMHDLKSSAS